MTDMLYLRPSTLEEASSMLKEYGIESCILNGGTDVVVRLREKLMSPNAIIDIKHIPGLNTITFNKTEGLFIGACCTLGDIAHNKDVFENYPFLADACESVGSGQIRNRATMIGNNVNASPLADTATPLLVLDAVAKVYSDGQIREIPMNEFFKGVRRTAVLHHEIVTGIQIPYCEDMKGKFFKNARRSKVDLSTVCLTIARIDGKYKIAMGSVAPTPLRAYKAEEFLNSSKLDLDAAIEAGRIASTECNPIDDVRSTREYRIEMVSVLVKRGLIEILNLEVTK